MDTFYKGLAITFFFVGTIGLAPFSHAEEYNLSYGARLTEANGAPILGQDGKLDLEVSFYNAGSGGSSIGPSPILFAGTSIAEGVFQLSITLTPTDFHQVFQDPSTPVYIEVKDVKSGAVFPRQRFSVIPFALKTPIDNDTIIYSSDGKLTVGSGVGTVKQITAGSGLTGGTITDSGTITVDVGTTGNKIVQLSDGKLPSVDGSNLSGVNAEKLQTRNVSAAVPVSGQVLKWSGSAWVPSSDLVGETGSGEANTASNVTSGSGVGLFKAKVSADLRFYSLSPGAGVTVNLVGDDVMIASNITQYTDSMAKAAAVADSITDSVTNVAPSQNAVFDALALKSPTTHHHDTAYEPKGLSTDVVTTTKILNDAVTSAKIASGVDATKIGGGGVDNTEFGYLNGVTSAIQTQLDGKVVGPASATDNAIARFDGTTGKLVQNSSVMIDDSGNMGIGTSPVSKLDVNGDIKFGNSSAICNGTTEGSQRYNSSSKQFEGCDGSSWIVLGRSGGDIPSGSIAFFNLSACPSGWTDKTSSFGGRYVIAKLAGGTSGTSVGSAFTSPTENRAVGLHAHTATQSSHYHTVSARAGGAGGDNLAAPGIYAPVESATTSSVAPAITVNNEGSVSGTNAPYVQFLACEKN